jgi:hypothetical protein
MCTANAVRVSGDAFDTAPDALRAAVAAMDYLNSASAADLAATACGELLIGLGEIQAKLTAAHTRFLRRFDAANVHDADGYGSSSAWLAAKAGMSKKAARGAVRQMRQLAARPLLDTALAAGDITDSLAFTLADWTRKLPAEMREETDRILLQAAAAGASLDDLATIAACAIESWRSQQPDPDTPDDGFDDRYLQIGTTFGGAAVIRGNLTPECAAAVRAVTEALGKKASPEDDRTEGKRFHDALQLACELLLRAKLVPDRAGADTQVIAHIPLSQLRRLPGAPDLEDAWIRARLGEDGYLTGKDAEAAACDAQTVPVVTGTMNSSVIDQMIDLARIAAQAGAPDATGQPPGRPANPAEQPPDDPADTPGQSIGPPGPAGRARRTADDPASAGGQPPGSPPDASRPAAGNPVGAAGQPAAQPGGPSQPPGPSDTPGPGHVPSPGETPGPSDTPGPEHVPSLGETPGPSAPGSAALSPEAWRALRYAMARLALDLVSGPAGAAAILRQGLLTQPYNTPSLPLDIGYSDTIPWHIRRAVLLRDKKCAWPKCGRPAVHCDVHHLRHKQDGGETTLNNLILLCQYHHDVCIHRQGWQLTLHPDGTTQARSPDGKQIFYSHAPPAQHAA